MSPRYGTIFEMAKNKAIRHRVREQEAQTVCGKIFQTLRGLSLWQWHREFQLISDASKKEDRCKKCYPKFRRKPWPTNLKKK